MKKIVNLMGKIPLPVTFIILMITDISHGALCAFINVKESTIVHGFTSKLFFTLAACYILIVATNLIDKSFSKAFKGKEINNQYTRLLTNALDSKIVDIQTISSGKTFAAVQELAALNASMKLSGLWILTAFMPFITLMVKEFQFNPLTMTISLISLPVAIFMSFMSEKLFKFSEEQNEKNNRLKGVTADNFLNIRTIKYLNAKKYALNRLKKSQDEAWDSTVNLGQILYFRLVDIICLSPLIINIYICRSSLEMIALLVVSNWSLDNMRGNLINVAELIIEIRSNKKILKPLKGDDTNKAKSITKDIILEDVFFDYGKDSPKFHIPYMKFPKGTKTLVVGESGSGKSSLANLLAGAIKPTTGTMENMEVFYIWQETESLDDSLWNNIVFHNPYNITEKEVLKYFRDLNMLDWFKSLKDGFNTHIGEKGCKLSSGQKQRINIIRAIIEIRNSPDKLFILDEITSNLDDVTRDLAIKLFKKNMKNITAIIISHNDGFDQLCDRKITVENHEFICGEI